MNEKLTKREQEIFDLLLEGTSPNEIASKLNVSYSTVDHYRSKLYQKLNVRNIQELLVKYSQKEDTKNIVDTVVIKKDETEITLLKNKIKILFILLIAFFLLFLGTFIILIRQLVNSSEPKMPNTEIKIEDISQSGFIIYDDKLNDRFILDSYSPQSAINFLSTDAAQGEYAIHWSNIEKMNFFWISFPGRDLSYFVQNGYVLEFKLKTKDPVKYDVKFTHYENNILWHIGYNLREQEWLLSNDEWHTIRIPLVSMNLWGGHNEITGEWHLPDEISNHWTNICILEFIAVHDEEIITEIYLDDIIITK